MEVWRRSSSMGDAPPMVGNLARAGASRTRLSGLDGLRGLAVMAVMAFHFAPSALPGGFVGVDIFFVLSGYLITSLLLGESRAQGRPGLLGFWARRARRLLPCLLLVVVAVTAYVRYAAPAGTYPGYRLDALSALFFFSNWHQIADATNYWDATGAVSPLLHTWSLAIEEQFYVVWPVVVLGVVVVARGVRRAAPILLGMCIAGAVASATEMAVLFQAGSPNVRIYFGTDTHAQGLLVGGALACGLAIVQWRRGAGGPVPVVGGRVTGRAVSVLGIVGLGGLAVLSAELKDSSALTYRGGFALASVASAAVILAAVGLRSGVLARALSLRPLAWMGQISYGLYLWHFPLLVFLSPVRTGASGVTLFGERVGATIVVATISYYGVERPIMRGTFWRSMRSLVPAGGAMAVAASFIVTATMVPTALASPVARVEEPKLMTVSEGHPGASTGGAVSETTPPLVVVLGDSTALTLGHALAATAPVGTTVKNDGQFGCGLAIGTEASGDPPDPGLTMFPPCNAATASAEQWPAVYARSVADTGPGDVVVFLAGRWETQGILRNGVWTNILAPSFQSYELGQMRTLAEVATAHGAHLDFLTMACMDPGAAIGEPPGPSDSAARREIYNHLLEEAASEFPGQVSMIDYGSILCPGGQYEESLDGVQIRTADGIHTPSYAPGNPFVGNSSEAVADRFYSWLAPQIWPQIIGLR
jgi:peptidoglycan/LPS O-acetylase OafA/YrhL